MKSIATNSDSLEELVHSSDGLKKPTAYAILIFFMNPTLNT